MSTQNIYDLTDTWNAAGTTFTAIKMNVTDTASASGSLLMDLQVGGSSRFSISKAGSVLAPIGSAAAPTFAFGVSNTGWYSSVSSSIVDLSIGGTQNLRFSANGMFFTTAAGTVQVSSGGSFSFSSGTAGAASADTILTRDAANTLAQRNSTNAQLFRIYSTFTDASNYERLAIGMTGSTYDIVTQNAGTGVARQLRFGNANTIRWVINDSGHFVAGADNTYDIGASGANRPRNLYLGGGIFANAPFVLTGNPGGGGATSRYISGAGTTTDWYFNVPTGGTHYFATAEVQRWQINPSGNFLAGADNTYDIGASGANRPRNLYVGTAVFSNALSITSAAGSNRANIIAPSDGIIGIYNAANTDFSRLQFGGTTSSFPALKRNATALETKLADDSAYAPHAMQYLDVTDGITAPAAATGRARIYVDTADGDLKVIFADGTIKTIVTDT